MNCRRLVLAGAIALCLCACKDQPKGTYHPPKITTPRAEVVRVHDQCPIENQEAHTDGGRKVKCVKRQGYGWTSWELE